MPVSRKPGAASAPTSGRSDSGVRAAATAGGAERGAPSAPPPVTLRDAYRFFLPLMFMAELMFISHAAISAFLARMADPEPILAAYSMSFYLSLIHI